MKFTSINPATEAVIATYPESDSNDVSHATARAYAEHVDWARRSIEERGQILIQIADLLERDVDETAHIITQEMGKPIAQSRDEVYKCAAACRYFAEIAPRVLADEPQAMETGTATISYEAIGVVVAIMPWNFPLWQFFRFAAPALIAGNGILLKHAPTTWGCALKAVALCHEAGVPSDVVQCVRIGVDRVEWLISDVNVRAVTFTGSTRGGQAVAALAGRHLKKCVAELGGNDAYIVCDDADMDVAVEACVKARTINSGQSCIAAKRFIVHEDVADEFTRLVAKRFDEMIVGDPMDPATEIGPMARQDLKDALLAQVQTALDQGARTATKRSIGDVPEKGFFVRPTLLVNVDFDNCIFLEETFGPVIGVVRFTTDADAVAKANNSRYGLGAAVFSRDITRATKIASELECGMVAINDFVRSDAKLPFGGTKHSGYGRELGVAGLREFVNIKVVRG